MAQLSQIRGLGPAKVSRLNAAGVHTVQDLASLDLRKNRDIGVGNDVLKNAKREARRLLESEGIPYEKAPYKEDAPARAPKATKPTPKSAPARAPPEPVVPRATTAQEQNAPKRGFFARLFGRK